MPHGQGHIEQLGAQRYVIEVEAGTPFRRQKRTATSLEEAIDVLYSAWRGAVPEEKPVEDRGAPQEVDPALFPPKPPVPIGKQRARRMRAQADAAA